MPSTTFILIGLAALLVGAIAGVLLATWRERRSAERSRMLEGKVRESEHMAYVGRLTGRLAHELKNPLSTLNLNLQLLAEDLARPETDIERRTARKLEILKQETQRLEQVLESFMRFAGRIELKRKRIDPAELVQDLLAFYEPQAASHRITLRATVPSNLPLIDADTDLLKQALLNLILNAQAAMPDGGELIVALRAECSGVSITVTDTGCGITADQLPKIFEAYFSTRRGGTGLGLPIVQRIVSEHGGTIAVTSEVGRGTQFTLWLPAAPLAM